MNVLIVEDEPLAAERLEGLVHQYDPSINIMGMSDTVTDAAQFMKTKHDELDLVFLDIQLADGKSFEIFTKIDYYKPVIFTTAYDQYALKAFKLNSIDYLLKPIKLEELTMAIDKFKTIDSDHKSNTLDADLINALLQNQAKSYKQRFLVKFGSRIQFKKVDEIGCFFAEDKICYLIERPTAKRYIIDNTLEDLNKELLDPNLFFRINRQFIVRIDCIKEIKSYANNRLEVFLNIPNEHKLVVSRNNVSDFKKWLNT